MEDRKKPDQVVFNTDTNRYDAALKPYATNVGAPAIRTTDTSEWKNRSINKLNHKVNARYREIRLAYEALIEEFEYNKLIYNAEFAFEPNLGEVYHLYKKDRNKTFLSIIAPEECSFKFLGSFRLNTDHIWEKIVQRS
ncbi:DUF2452 domain-containing protein [Robertkochia sediminum]|uniref:DUF2452 domain-containing protein n=1 Tax=Robertkochia sediminum TaxID=2785326 RepID=UPI00193231A0|nr:DUF2452 domain-containing protein [Robertkochia sediminum]MBL7473269.1 DUF2452 domain-containing protein [Robertkochia sediminum]